MVYEYFKDLPRKTAYNKLLRDKLYNIAKNPKYNGYQRGLDSMVYKFFDQNSTIGGGVKNENMSNQELGKNISQINY